MARNTLRVYVTADGAPAVRAFEEVGEASTVATDKIEAGSAKQTAAMDETREGAHRLRDSVGMLAGTLGLGGLAFGVKDVIEAGEQWQAQQAQLQNALKNTGEYSQRNMALVRDSAEKLSVKGGFAGPEEIAAMNQFIRLTGSATESVKLNKDAMNLARGAGIGYGQAQSLIERSMAGSTRGLQRYLGIIQPVKTAEFALTQSHGFNLAAMEAQSKALGKLAPLWLKHEEILHNLTPAEVQHAQLLDKQATATRSLQMIQEKYGSSMTTFSKTTQGALSNMKNQFDLLGETIGRKFLPAVTAAVGFVGKHLTTILIVTGALTGLAIAIGIVKFAIDAWKVATIVMDGVMTVSGVIIGAVADAVGLLRVGFIMLGVDASAAWVLATGGLILLVAAIALVVTHFKQFREIVGGVWDWMKGAAGTVARAVSTAFTAVDHWVVTAFANIKRFVGGVWISITRNVQSTVATIGHVFSGIFHVIAWPFQEAWKIIKTIFDDIKNGLKHLLGPLGGLLHGIGSVGSDVGGFLSHPFGLHTGGIVPHMATGGILGGYGGGDRWPVMLESGEGVLRKEAVQSMGSQNFNAINATGSAPSRPSAGASSDQVYVSAPVQLVVGQRVMAEQTLYFAARKSALSGRYVSG
jgi:hypothetical protein